VLDKEYGGAVWNEEEEPKVLNCIMKAFMVRILR